jgi:hypothetical protein
MSTTESVLARARTFLWSNGRLLERRLFEHLFEGGSRDAVLRALAAYCNRDGGFGQALEPDERCSDSQPIDQDIALRVLDDVGFDPEVARSICDFLTTISTDEGGVPFVLPTVRSAPRAPWWNTEDDPPARVTPTASIAGLLHKHRFEHPWLERATEFCWGAIARIETGEVHDVMSAVLFLEHVPDRRRAEAELERLSRGALQSHVERDPNASAYVHKVLDWAPTPAAWTRRLFEDQLIEEHLDALLAEQQEDGGWAISWPAVSPGCELEFRGIVTLNRLKTLKAYGRLDERLYCPASRAAH